MCPALEERVKLAYSLAQESSICQAAIFLAGLCKHTLSVKTSAFLLALIYRSWLSKVF